MDKKEPALVTSVLGLSQTRRSGARHDAIHAEAQASGGWHAVFQRADEILVHRLAGVVQFVDLL